MNVDEVLWLASISLEVENMRGSTGHLSRLLVASPGNCDTTNDAIAGTAKPFPLQCQIFSPLG